MYRDAYFHNRTDYVKPCFGWDVIVHLLRTDKCRLSFLIWGFLFYLQLGLGRGGDRTEALVAEFPKHNRAQGSNSWPRGQGHWWRGKPLTLSGRLPGKYVPTDHVDLLVSAGIGQPSSPLIQKASQPDLWKGAPLALLIIHEDTQVLPIAGVLKRDWLKHVGRVLCKNLHCQMSESFLFPSASDIRGWAIQCLCSLKPLVRWLFL